MTPNERSKAWYEAHKNDPEFLAKKAARAKAFREANHQYYAEYRAQPHVKAKQQAASAKWIKNNPRQRTRYSWATNMRTKYGLEPEDVARMLEAQDRRCAIHGGARFRDDEEFCIDHSHKTGKVRGVLCHDCNVAIGRFRENSAALRKAADYIDKHA